MRTQTRLACFLFTLIGALIMTSSNAMGEQPAAPMKGPDFALGKIASWTEPPGAEPQLVLGDGSRWRLKGGAKNLESVRTFIAHALKTDSELFVSGDKASGLMDRVAAPRRLAVQEVEANPKNGRYAVLFFGPPSLYFLRIDRPWCNQALALLRKSAGSGAFLDSPDLLVSIDTVTSEIMDVRPLGPR